MPRVKQRTEGLHDRVVGAALGLLAQDGVPGLTARNVAREAATSTPAVYEIFGDKAGLVREVFFEGFRLLGERLEQLDETEDPIADLVAISHVYRAFVRDNPVLAQVMFSRPFTDFDPTTAESEAGAFVRRFTVGRVRRGIDAGLIEGNATDVAHALVALVQGLAAAETAQRLGRSKASVDRRWALAVGAMLRGLQPGRSGSPMRAGRATR